MDISKSFKGKNIIVIGGSSGIGEEYIRSVSALHPRCILNVDIKENPSLSISTPYRYHYLDLSSAGTDNWNNNIEDLKQTATTLGMYNNLDHLIFCAGIGEDPSDILKTDSGEINRLIHVNYLSFVKILSAFQSWLSPGASIVAITSAHGLRPAPKDAIYGSTKAAMNSLIGSYSKMLIETSQEKLIRINGVAPEGVKTPILDQVIHDEESMSAFVKSRNMHRLLSCTEVVDVMTFLGSDYASGLTGIVIPIGGVR